MSWLLDTCTISEYVRKKPEPRVIAWLDEQDEGSLFISALTLSEIEKGILKLPKQERRRSQKLTAWLAKVEQRFSGRILPLDAVTLRVWAQLTARSELGGKPLPVLDALLMATAQREGLTIVTRNVKDFLLYPHVFNPWDL